MTDKSYIVANKKQELDVLKKLENEGFKWTVDLPTKFIFSEALLFEGFPYVISTHEDIQLIGWSYYSDDYEGNIVFNGRKEEKMTKKYKVTLEFMDKLVEWRDKYNLDAINGYTLSYMASIDLSKLPRLVMRWWEANKNPVERNNRLIAIIQWLNGEDVFEVEEQNRFVVRSDKADRDDDYTYILVERDMTTTAYLLSSATKFDTREEAQEWANSHQVVVEIDAEGNEVE